MAFLACIRSSPDLFPANNTASQFIKCNLGMTLLLCIRGNDDRFSVLSCNFLLDSLAWVLMLTQWSNLIKHFVTTSCFVMSEVKAFCSSYIIYGVSLLLILVHLDTFVLPAELRMG